MMNEFDDGEKTLKLILSKLEILRNFLIVADDGMRQQQSAMNDEVMSVIKEIRLAINEWIRKHSP